MKRHNFMFLTLLLTLGLVSSGWAQSFGDLPKKDEKKSDNAAKESAAKPAAPIVPMVLPHREGSVKIAVFGDTGRGSAEQYHLGRVMNNFRGAFPYETVLMTGDNIYGSDKAEDMRKKFEDVYKDLIAQDVKFYASLGNHDSSNQRFYELQEFYKFEKKNVSFYALNTNYLDARQLDWLKKELAEDKNKWKVAFFHHPPYSSGGRHGSDEETRKILHPIFVQHGVDIVFTGHDHFYERIKPQDGITYFVAGAGGKIRRGDVDDDSTMTDAFYDRDLSFMMAEFDDDAMHFQVVSRSGNIVDLGTIKRRD